MNSNVNEKIYTLKFFAIFSVVCAHSCSVSSEHSFYDVMISRILESIGSVGVGVFMFVAGLFFYNSKKNFFDFFLTKIKTLIIPWVFSGSVVYLYVKLRKGRVDFFSYVKWILGVDTYLYFMTVLLFIYLLCFFVRKNKAINLFLIIVSIISNILTSFGFFDFVSPYLNPFNFLFLFVMGLLCAEYDFLRKMVSINKKFYLCGLFFYLIVISVLALNGIIVTYFKWFFILIEITVLFCLCGISNVINNCNKHVVDIGKLSFSVYLLHMPLAGIVSNLLGKIDLFLITMLRPVLVLFITYVSIKFLLFISKKLSFERWVSLLIGVR